MRRIALLRILAMLVSVWAIMFCHDCNATILCDNGEYTFYGDVENKTIIVNGDVTLRVHGRMQSVTIEGNGSLTLEVDEDFLGTIVCPDMLDAAVMGDCVAAIYGSYVEVDCAGRFYGPKTFDEDKGYGYWSVTAWSGCEYAEYDDEHGDWYYYDMWGAGPDAEVIHIAAEGLQTVDGYTWTYWLHNDMATIGYHSYSYSMTAISPKPTGAIVVPSKLDGRTVTSIGSWSFEKCTGLTSVIIPSSVTSIQKSAFNGCSGLTAFEVSEDNASYASVSGLLLSKDLATLVLVPNGLTNVAIPASVTSIADKAFYGCGGLASVTIPSGVTNIGRDAFSGCAELTSITIPDSVVDIKYAAFSGCSELANVCFEGAPPNVESYAFYNVKSGAVGTYLPAHAAEWEEVVDNNGYWNGLKMAPSLTLTAESADWSSGSITLRCEDADTSGATHKYTLSYYDEETKNWIDVGDDRAIDVTAVNGVAHLTDGFFSARFDGIPPVAYRVKDRVGRVSAPCVTRTKYGIFVAPGPYKPGRVDGEGNPIPLLQFAKTNADKFEMLANDYGKFNGKALTGSSATYKNLDDEFKKISDKIKPGDICFLYFVTHGGARKGSTVSSLELYDHSYSEQELATHLQSLNAVSEHNPMGNGVAVVGFVHACHSGGIIDNSVDDGIDGYCVPNAWCVNAVLLAENVAWVTATDDPKSIAFGNFFSEFLLGYGWEKGWADKNFDGALSCEEMADYTKKQTNDLFDGITMRNEYGQTMTVKTGKSDSHGILKHIVIGESGHHDGSVSVPTAPKIAAEGTDGYSITVTCKNIYDADAVVKFRRRGTRAPYEFWDAIGELNNNGAPCELKDIDVADSGGDCPYSYQIRTYNGAGVGKSNETSAWRVHYEMLKIGFMYDIPNANYGGWQWSSSYGESLGDSGIWENVHRKIDELDIGGRTLVGWFTERGGKGTKVTKETIVYSDKTYYGWWTPMTKNWLDSHMDIATASNGDIATAAAMTAANGCRTVGECYALGIDPEDPDDDFKVTHFEMKDGKPVITLNHTEDGSGNSFLPRVKTLGKADLSDAEWREVPEKGDSSMRFFKVEVEMP